MHDHIEDVAFIIDFLSELSNCMPVQTRVSRCSVNICNSHLFCSLSFGKLSFEIKLKNWVRARVYFCRFFRQRSQSPSFALFAKFQSSFTKNKNYVSICEMN